MHLYQNAEEDIDLGNGLLQLLVLAAILSCSLGFAIDLCLGSGLATERYVLLADDSQQLLGGSRRRGRGRERLSDDLCEDVGCDALAKGRDGS